MAPKSKGHSRVSFDFAVCDRYAQDERGLGFEPNGWNSVRPEPKKLPFVLSVGAWRRSRRTATLRTNDILLKTSDEPLQGRQMAFWVYLLRCADGSFYTGHTDNLELRFAQHQSGDLPGYTHDRRPVHLAFSQDFPTREEALSMELRLKGWSRAKKEALINNDWGEIKRLGHGKHLHQRKTTS